MDKLYIKRSLNVVLKKIKHAYQVLNVKDREYVQRIMFKENGCVLVKVNVERSKNRILKIFEQYKNRISIS